MIKEYEYRKTGTIKAVQLTRKNQWDLKNKYDDLVDSYSVTSDPSAPWYIHTLEGFMPVHYSDWIATGANGEHWAIRDEIFKKTYAELPDQPESEFEQLVNDLKQQVRATVRIGVWDNEDRQEVEARWPNGQRIARCFNLHQDPTNVKLEIFHQDPTITFWVRPMADALNKLSDFADKWKKLEEAKLKQ